MEEQSLLPRLGAEDVAAAIRGCVAASRDSPEQTRVVVQTKYLGRVVVTLLRKRDPRWKSYFWCAVRADAAGE